MKPENPVPAAGSLIERASQIYDFSRLVPPEPFGLPPLAQPVAAPVAAPVGQSLVHPVAQPIADPSVAPVKGNGAKRTSIWGCCRKRVSSFPVRRHRRFRKNFG
jgi:hypothetical protein